jgi:hypothetical protein
MKIQLLGVVLLFQLFSNQSFAQYIAFETFANAQRVASAASSCVWGCSNAAFTNSNAMDGVTNTAWSSNANYSPGGTEWIAVWFQTQRINNVRLTPRIVNGRVQSLPQFLNLYYSDGVQWVYSTTLETTGLYILPGVLVGPVDIPLRNVPFSNGVLIIGAGLKPDDYGGVYFQAAEITPSLRTTYYTDGTHTP